ncbi:MAG: DUF6468 domain-containing protein [Rhodospirillales bacterium]
MILGLVVDGLLVVLLAATVVFAFQLNRRLAAIRADQGEFGRQAASFAEAATRAEDSVARLKVAAGASQDEIDRAERLADDLRYLMERGTSLADRLEGAVTSARDTAMARPRPKPALRPTSAAAPGAAAASTIVPAAPSPAAPAANRAGRTGAGAGAGQPRSRAERELLAALRSAGLSQ